jgi:hypothetical protein
MNHDSPLRSANESDRTDRCDSSGVAPRGRIALEPTLMRGCMGVRMYRNERLPPLFAVYPNDSSESVAVHLTGSTRVTPPVDHPVEAFRRASCRGQGWRCKAPRPLRAHAGAREHRCSHRLPRQRVTLSARELDRRRPGNQTRGHHLRLPFRRARGRAESHRNDRLTFETLASARSSERIERIDEAPESVKNTERLPCIICPRSRYCNTLNGLSGPSAAARSQWR